uniref:Sarcolemmal membrane-associated protein n=1 Tax=Anoplophora glabripennis TaxID=217634 RepID=V5G949_ANOGL
MVVVSASWMKNVATYPPPIINTDIVLPNEKRMAKAILICRPNSHHFQERTLTLDQPVKVGRSVARAKPTSTNAIFDCKVLSRHHALLWYEDGKFYLQDTKSSNGTFVNNNKLPAETENHELSSGDIVQFGVDVVENNRKVTHGCIIATIKLYLPDGKEAKASPSITDSGRHGIVPLDDLYRLNQIIQEANQREQYLETKLTALQQIVDDTRKSTEESWQAYVGEERLLSRVSALENQLQQVNKNWGEDRLREELVKLREDNEAYQVAAKETLEKLHAERLQAVALAMEQERARIAAEQETFLAKEQFTQAQLELEEVAQKFAAQQKKAEEQRIKLEQHEQELEARLEMESEKVLDLQLKLHELSAVTVQDIQTLQDTEGKHNLLYDHVKSKEEILAENEFTDAVLNKSNGINNHISLMVHPVLEENESDLTSDKKCKSDPNEFCQNNDMQEDTKRLSVKMPDDSDKESDINELEDVSENCMDYYEKDIYGSEHVDSKTLKYQFQSAQNELRKKIELLESISNGNKQKIAELDKALHEEKNFSHQKLIENEDTKTKLILYDNNGKES